MTAQQAILLLGTFTMAGCGAGLVLVHGSNPLLKGLNWMGTALVVAGLGAALTLGADTWHVLEPLANLSMLAALICCNRADRYLVGADMRVGRFGLALLSVQAAAMLLQWTHLLGSGWAATVVCVLVSIQIASTVRLIRGNSATRGWAPTRATSIIMGGLMVAFVARGTCAALGLLADPTWKDSLNLLSYGCFVAFAVAMAFAFFWRTTAKLSGELEHMASTDPLTRVFNRRTFLQWCEGEQTRSLRLHVPFSVLMLDFDHFKAINDTYGHHIGDQVLCSAVERIQDAIRGIDVLCRWGGEEFTVLLPNASEEATLIVAERVRRNLQHIDAANPRFAEELPAELKLTASIGTATFEGDEDSYQMMLQRADEALYRAKRSGRNCVMRSVRARPEREMVGGQLSFKTP